MMIRNGITWAAIWVRRVVVGRSMNLFVFWRRSMFESVSRPEARNEVGLHAPVVLQGRLVQLAGDEHPIACLPRDPAGSCPL